MTLCARMGRLPAILAGDGITVGPTIPRSFVAHPNLSDEVNCHIAQSEIEGGVRLEDLAQGSRLEVQTQHRWYTVVNCGDGWVLISGHPKYCPSPLLVRILGSNWGGSMLKMRFIGRSMHLEFKHPEYRAPIITSRIVEIREVAACEERAACSVEAPVSAGYLAANSSSRTDALVTLSTPKTASGSVDPGSSPQ